MTTQLHLINIIIIIIIIIIISSSSSSDVAHWYKKENLPLSLADFEDQLSDMFRRVDW